MEIKLVKNVKEKCPHCGKGYHKPEDCWTKHPEKRPSKAKKALEGKFYSMMENFEEKMNKTNEEKNLN
jgi:hypothetical protein